MHYLMGAIPRIDHVAFVVNLTTIGGLVHKQGDVPFVVALIMIYEPALRSHEDVVNVIPLIMTYELVQVCREDVHYAEVLTMTEEPVPEPPTNRSWQHRKASNIAKAQVGYVCQVCGSKKEIEAHHIHSYRAGGDPCVSNLLVVCRYCHDQIEKGEIGIRQYFPKDPFD